MFDISNTLHQAAGSNQFFSGGLLLMAIGAAAAYARRVPDTINRLVYRKFGASLTVDNQDRSYQWLKFWIESQEFGHKARHLVVSSIYPNRDMVLPGERRKPTVILTPAPGWHLFWYKGSLMWAHFSREKMRDGSDGPGESGGMIVGFHESVIINTFSPKAKTLFKNLMEEARAASEKVYHDKLCIYGGDQWGSWQLVDMKRPRPKDSVVLDGTLMEDLVADLDRFLKNEEWYQERGIPWKRGYLLYGAPGGGKSSIIMALAAHFSMDIYFLSLAEVKSDQDLSTKLLAVPKGNILVIEEIDTVFRGRERIEKNKVMGPTIGGLLNALDGITSVDGRILFMTTNHQELLDSALIRPGRVDRQIEIPNASRDQLRRLFLRFYPKQEALAQRFSEAVPERTVSMAAAQEHFMTYRDCPEKALENVRSLVLPPATVEAIPTMSAKRVKKMSTPQ